MRPCAKATTDVRGGALPGVLMVMAWLTAIGGWLLAHVVWDQRVASVDTTTTALAAVADAMGEAARREVGRVADWQALTTADAPRPCPGGGSALPPEIDVAQATARLQAATDALSRWPSAARPAWRLFTACPATALLGQWRGRLEPPWALAWVADDPDGGVDGGAPIQLVLHVVATRPAGGWTTRTLTIRRYPAQMQPRLVAWRPG